ACFALISLGSSIGADIGPSAVVGAIIAFIISLPLHCVISASAYVYFFRVSWGKALVVWLWQLAIVVGLGLIIGLLTAVTLLPLRYQLALAVAVMVILAVLVRQGWITIFGPVLFYDLVRIA